MHTPSPLFRIASALLCAALCGPHTAQAQPAGGKPALPAPTATAVLPTAPPMMGTATDHEVTKLRYELAKVKADLGADIAKLRADLTALTEQQKALVYTYEGHTHKTLAYDFGLVPTKIKCFKASDCEGMFFDKEPHQAVVIHASKPVPYTGQGGKF